MSYTPGTDFIALLRSTGGGVRTERMPGLDYVIAALARANLISVVIGQTAPVANQATTVWFKPAVPSWTGEGVVFLWNATAGVYQVATAALWSLLIAGPFISLIPAPGNANPLIDGVVNPGVSLLYSRQDHIHPTDTSRAPFASPVFTGNPQGPTPTFGDNTTSLATTAFVQQTAGVPPPIGMVVPYAGSAAPSANWQICTGQAVSRSVFSVLFAALGITFGSGDGITTFNLPDLRGRAVAGVDGGVNRLTTATMTSQALGGTSTAAETKALATSNMPPYTPAGSVAGTFPTASSNSTGTIRAAEFDNNAGSAGNITASFSGTPQGGTSVAFSIVQPTIELNYIIRVA